MEAVGLLLVLGGLALVYGIMLRPPTGSAKARRRALGISGNHRDHDPIAASLLVAIAIADVGTTATGFGLVDAVAVGVLLALVLRVPGARGLVYVAVGAVALLSALRELATDEACGGGLTTVERASVYFVTFGFLLVLALTRMLVAPLRATRSEVRGALLAVYGVLQGTVLALQLQAGGAFEGWPLPSYAAGALCLLVLAFGTAVQPVFATSALGVGLAVLSVLSVGGAACLDSTAVFGVIVGYAAPSLAFQTVRRR